MIAVMGRLGPRFLVILLLLLSGFVFLVAWGVGLDMTERLENQSRHHAETELALVKQQFFDLAVVEDYAGAVRRLQVFGDANPEVRRLRVITPRGTPLFLFERPVKGRTESHHATVVLGPGERVQIEMETDLSRVDAIVTEARERILLALLLVIIPLGIGMWLVVRQFALQPMEQVQHEQLRGLIDLIPHPICACDGYGAPWLTNQACDISLGGRPVEPEQDALVLANQRAMTLPEIVSQTTPDGIRDYMVSKIPFQPATHSHPSVLTVALDLTERKRVEAELQESEAKYRRIFESIEDGYILANLDGRILSVNPATARLLKYDDPSQLEGENIADKVYADTRERKRLKAILERDRSVHSHTLHFRRRDGQIIIVECNIHLVFDHNNRPAMIEGTFRDVSARKRLEAEKEMALERAKSASRSKSEFLANMSHEIRTPMNAVMGMGELLLETPLTETQKWCVTTLNNSGEVLLHLINDILDLSKIEAGQLTLERTAFDVRRSVDETMELFTFTALDKGLDFHHQVDESVPHWVLGDSTRLRQVLLNLVGNAFKFTQQGRVSVSVGQDSEGRTSFLVKDTGPGIPPEQHEEIFQPFSQADASTTRHHGGTGLGLTICRRLVGLMGGELALKSQIGQGSAFTFTLPLPASEAPGEGSAQVASDVSSTAAMSDRHWPELRILMVEDGEENRMVIQGFLKQTDCGLTTAENGAEAVELFKSGDFHLVLMDIQMPVMDGYAATRAIRAWERETSRKRTPIAALTAHALSEEAERIKAGGFDMHLTKPVRKKRLLDAIETMIGDARSPS